MHDTTRMTPTVAELKRLRIRLNEQIELVDDNLVTDLLDRTDAYARNSAAARLLHWAYSGNPDPVGMGELGPTALRRIWNVVALDAEPGVAAFGRMLWDAFDDAVGMAAASLLLNSALLPYSTEALYGFMDATALLDIPDDVKVTVRPGRHDCDCEACR